MKNLFLTIVLSCCFTLAYAQDPVQVNSNPNANADFTNLQEAIDSVAAGTVIYLYGAGGDYGNITISKPLTIVGPGYFLDENPKTQVNVTRARIIDLTIAAGTQHVYITGISVRILFVAGAENIILQRNEVSCSINLNNSSAVTINGCYFPGTCNGDDLHITNSSSNVTVSNCIFPVGNGRSIFMGTNSFAVFKHNIIDDDPIIRNSFLENNIFLDALNGNSSNNTFQHNVFVPDVGGLHPSNKVNVAEESLFVGVPDQADFSIDGRYVLQANSPAKGAGINGLDAGVFDGKQPYVLSGIPFIPNVFELEAAQQGTSGSGLEVTIKAKANKQ